jgi:putative oxidoreductase
MGIVKTAAVWTLQIGFGALCLLVGTGKFGDPNWVRRFAEWGYPAGFYLIVGALEIIGGLLILVPRVATYGSLLIMTVMLGAIVTHLTHGEMRRLIAPTAFLLIAAGVGWLRRHDVRPLARAREGKRAVI